MNTVIRSTLPSEADELAKLQQAAFSPLYEKYHDGGNPCLRGPEDILKRLNKHNRYYTIFLEGKIVGGICYRLKGKRAPSRMIENGEYYLARVFIDPEYQSKGVAREAILLCEKEFPDAKKYYVDFPEDMEKNRRCYQSAGYRDTGVKLCQAGAPPLAMFEKAVTSTPVPKEVKMPLVFTVEKEELSQCLNVIHESFKTVADEFQLTQENCPKHTSFLPLVSLETQMDWGWHMYGLYAGKKIIGYMVAFK